VTVLVPLIVACAFVSAAVALVTGRSGRAALRVLLDLLLAAGLVHLSFGLSWQQIAVAAAVVLIRRLVTSSILRGAPGDVRGALIPGGRPARRRAHRGHRPTSRE
jgi:hypothetical protein